jgi:ribosomal protein RSM22 (predicted rRNA methylase)
LTASLDLPQHDLLIPSYASGELGNAAASRLVQAAWTITRDVLVIIEPDTVPGFNRIQMVRDQLITLGAHVIAPCPTQTPARCPATTGAIFHSAWTAPRFIV